MIGILRRVVRAWLPARRPIVLMYHRIAPVEYDPWDLAVSPARFDEQLAELRREREVLPLPEFGLLLARGRLPARAAAITFDDGYACNALVAAPILRAHRLPATFFLTTGAIGTDREFWWDELARLVVETQAPVRASLVIRGRPFGVDLAATPVPDAALKGWTGLSPSEEPRIRAYQQLWTALRPLPHAERRALLDSIWAAYGRSPRARASHRAMTRDEAHGLSACGLFHIAPHTISHPALGGLSEAEQRREIVESRAACLALGRNMAALFAYPYGDLTPLTARIVRDTGFAAACTTRPGSVERRCDPFEIPRIQAIERPVSRGAGRCTTRGW